MRCRPGYGVRRASVMMLIDAHAHLDRYGELLSAAVKEIEDKSILTVSNSMDFASYRRNLAIGKECSLVVPTFGVHPKNAPGSVSELTTFGAAIDQTPMIGEIGLDFHWVRDSAQYPAQKRVLEYFLAAAREQRKIVNLHTKGAEKEVLVLLERYGVQRAIVHWYSGPVDILRAMIAAGFYFTIGVEVLFSDTIKEIARLIPLDQMLTETDNPGGLKWLNGSPGMPNAIDDVVRVGAKIKTLDSLSFADSVQANWERLTRGDLWLDAVRKQTARA